MLMRGVPDVFWYFRFVVWCFACPYGSGNWSGLTLQTAFRHTLLQRGVVASWWSIHDEHHFDKLVFSTCVTDARLWNGMTWHWLQVTARGNFSWCSSFARASSSQVMSFGCFFLPRVVAIHGRPSGGGGREAPTALRRMHGVGRLGNLQLPASTVNASWHSSLNDESKLTWKKSRGEWFLRYAGCLPCCCRGQHGEKHGTLLSPSSACSDSRCESAPPSAYALGFLLVTSLLHVRWRWYQRGGKSKRCPTARLSRRTTLCHYATMFDVSFWWWLGLWPPDTLWLLFLPNALRHLVDDPIKLPVYIFFHP